jgi:hypothetical protein
MFVENLFGFEDGVAFLPEPLKNGVILPLVVGPHDFPVDAEQVSFDGFGSTVVGDHDGTVEIGFPAVPLH